MIMAPQCTMVIHPFPETTVKVAGHSEINDVAYTKQG